MKKSLLAFLAALMLFSVMPVGAADTAATDAAATTLSDDMRFVQALNIMDSAVSATEPLTRIELAKCYYNIIMNGADITGYEMLIFDDVSGDAAAAELCYNYGIMTGTDTKKFSPDQPVTFQQLMKTMVVFLGYESRANAEGGWPYGYLAVASSLGLCKNVTTAMDANVTAEQVAKVLHDSIDISLMQRTTYGTYGYETKYGDNWLRLYRNITRYRGAVEANHMTDLGGRNPRDYERVIVGGTEYLLNEQTLDLKNQIGYKVDIYVDVTNDPGTVMYWEYLQADTVEINGDDIAGFKNGRLDYYGENGKEYIELADDAWVVYNGTYCGSYDESILNPFKTSYLEGSLTAVDNNGDGEYDYVEVDAYDTYVVSSIVDKKIFTKYRNNVVIDTDELDENHIMMTNVTGDEMWLSALSEGDILSVSYDMYGNVKRVVVTIDKLKGTITEISDEGDGIYKIGIGDKVYDCSKSIVLNEQFAGLKVGDPVRVFFNKDGKVSDIERNEFINHSIGYLVDAAPIKGMSKTYEVKIFTAGNSMEIYKVAEKVEVEGVDGKIQAEDAIDMAYSFSTGSGADATGDGTEIVPSDRVPRQVVQYDVDEETGLLTYIDYCEGMIPVDSLYEYDPTNWYGKYYRAGAKSFSGQLMIGGVTAIFDVPKEEFRDDDDAYYIGTFPNVDSSSYGGDYSSMRAFGNDANSKVAAAMVMVRKEQKSYSVKYDANMFTIGKITNTVNSDGESVVKVTGIMYGKEYTYYAESGILNIAPGDTLPSQGDIIRVATDNENNIKNAEFVFDESTRTLTAGMGEKPSSANGGQSRYVYGKVTYASGGFITVEVTNGSDTWEEVHNASSFRITCYKKNADEGNNAATVSIGKAENIYDEYHYPTIGSEVVIHTNYWYPKSITVYND